MRHDITPELAGAFIRKAHTLGYEVQRVESAEEPKICLSAFMGEQRICRFEKGGDMRFFRDDPHEKERNELHRLLLSMKEAYDLYRDARPLEVDGVKGFRIISEYGDVVLAARMDEQEEVKYVTWEYCYKHMGVTIGHYFETNYEGAKKDFAIRAGLIPQDQIFTEEELMTLHAACVFYGENFMDITYSGEKELQMLMEKLEEILPEQTADAASQQLSEVEQEDEHGIQ